MTGGENFKMKNQILNEREKKIVSILKKYTRKNNDKPNKNGQQNKANKHTKKRVNFKLGAEKKRNNKGTRKVNINIKSSTSAKQVKIRNRTLTPMPISSSL